MMLVMLLRMLLLMMLVVVRWHRRRRRRRLRSCRRKFIRDACGCVAESGECELLLLADGGFFTLAATNGSFEHLAAHIFGRHDFAVRVLLEVLLEVFGHGCRGATHTATRVSVP